MRKRLAPWMRLVVPALVAVSAVGCGSETGPTPPPVTQPPRPSKANIIVTVGNVTVAASPRSGFRYRLAFDLTLRETAGLGAKLNFIRCDFRDSSGAAVERQEAGSNTLNRVEANASLTGRLTVDFNDSRTATVLLTVSATDDNGNPLEVTFLIT